MNSISVHNVGKRYFVKGTPDFWAVRDVSFDAKPGEIIGIIGRNGSGKSTLLKLVANIVLPTSGYMDICGRCGSMLELGAGFHPELTGRENIYLSGAILGMKRKEIMGVFDSIVDFAEIRDFLDTQVKHYSSGMYVRLAFAISTHTGADNILVDEILSVGDFEFREKCFKKIEEMSRDGKTILFVSHDMETVERVCSRVIVLSDGGIVMDSPPKLAIDVYTHKYVEE